MVWSEFLAAARARGVTARPAAIDYACRTGRLGPIEYRLDGLRVFTEAHVTALVELYARGRRPGRVSRCPDLESVTV